MGVTREGGAGLPTASFPVPERPHHWVNSQGLGLRLQCFLAVRDAERRVACVRLKASPDAWSLPGESLQPNEDVHAAAARVAASWFATPLEPRLADVLTWPDDGDGKWYVLFVYEAEAPGGRLQAPDDTLEVAFASVGKPPGSFGMDHAAVFARLRR